MPCIRYRTAISAHADGNPLPPGVTDLELETHLTACPDCRRWSKRLRALREATEDLRRHRRAGTPSKPV
ncbi:zf-HC2 domain-containing protein [Streptomyces sp. DSM 44917]|uniref:Zf-HC2 domain-containing protein n=1 Tax=Streptomyces boetiae TaxID=3075541 RepID=A0ABU2LA02_9ACTN|nr:zf-HC2 domain-containing protein [Streptomyces sp. DSM 44917]MDT0308401.1 zf-HC2 domain-containing protein [Streptomyces sp. DSM 44917]